MIANVLKLRDGPSSDESGPLEERLDRGRRHFEAGAFADAAACYAAAAKAFPESPEAHFNEALSLSRLKEWTAAAEAFARALRCRTDWIEARIGRGACLLHVGRFGEALSQFELALETSPSQPAAFGRAVALQLLRRHEKAVEAYSDVRGAESYENVICLAIECGDLFSARRITRELLEMDPSSRVGLLARATLAFHDGDMQGAARSCTRLLEIDPENVEAWLNLQYASQRRVGELTRIGGTNEMSANPMPSSP